MHKTKSMLINCQIWNCLINIGRTFRKFCIDSKEIICLIWKPKPQLYVIGHKQTLFFLINLCSHNTMNMCRYFDYSHCPIVFLHIFHAILLSWRVTQSIRGCKLMYISTYVISCQIGGDNLPFVYVVLHNV